MIKLLVLDVDGTLTDGGVYLDGRGNEFKRFDIQDGMGISRLRQGGVEVAIISGRYSPATEGRAKELGIALLQNGVKNKYEALKKLASDLALPSSQIAYAGDDVNDVECLQWVGLGFAVANAVSEAKKAADRVTTKEGGRGAIREAAEYILAYNKEWVTGRGDSGK
ncbi:MULTISPECIES: KdsC family phosphatase [Aminobacterium]|jgi:3-deoxy-D-manno-octulosonate 8-phosphate phosphatase (KDO 8-P phosphatase)|nr:MULTISPECIES: HAD-IIIA family hydrolase [Aminobacterium]MDD2378484.1 HAD-IIIA family hydrolase [Aminobacterium colombiense]MDD3768494.1 HAD-IIIA family hydrolase [Aminobacterium colombiense]MDD4265029.1 HAD-IIIA family hydrolase [Aminobacterium colombiense]MDD4586257.1 HAD-IIIA family hydrolase [Aminobacterium colombiense]